MVRKIVLIFLLIMVSGFFIALKFDLLPERVTYLIEYSRCKILYTLGKAGTGENYESSRPSERFHRRSVSPDIPLSEIMSSRDLKADDNINIHIDIETRTLFLKYKDETLKKYRIAAGSMTDKGNKQREGDYRTPRGSFYICTKDIYSPPKGYLGSRWMLLSYPDTSAAERGLASEMISQDVYNEIIEANKKMEIPPQNTLLGSAIGIHGGARPDLSKDWTAGCIGVYNQDVEEIFEFVKVGTKVVIE
ncbi:MAG: L,D-transpeptidase family protein [Bacillota bacterium]